MSAAMHHDDDRKRDCELKEKIEYFKILADHYRMDVQAVWQRASAFIVINGALLAIYGTLYAKDAHDVNIAISILAFVLCVLWFVNQFVTTRWLEEWRRALCELDTKITFCDGFGGVFNATEQNSDGDKIKRLHAKIRPQYTAMLMPVVIMPFWMLFIVVAFIRACHRLF